jgi:hypothetical protein
MTDKPMTLVERLRNPAYHGSGLTRGKPADLDVKRTISDMAEAADEIENLRCVLGLIANDGTSDPSAIAYEALKR